MPGDYTVVLHGYILQTRQVCRIVAESCHHIANLDWSMSAWLDCGDRASFDRLRHRIDSLDGWGESDWRDRPTEYLDQWRRLVKWHLRMNEVYLNALEHPWEPCPLEPPSVVP
jgi:hypothetical protein